MHLSKIAQIAHLKADEAPSKVPSKYANFADVLFLKFAAKLPKHTEINNPTIELVDDWQSLYSPIYSLELIKLEILKTYIQNNLANSFIRPFKSPIGVLILFDKKPDGSLRLYVDYRGLNNLIIKNWYPLSLVRESVMTWSPDLVMCPVTWHGAQPHPSIYEVMKSALTATTLRPTNYARYQTYAWY